MTILDCRGRGCRASAVLALALAFGSVGLAGCAGDDDPSAEDVATRFAKMHVHEGPTHGSIRVPISKPGEVWVLVERDDLKNAAPQKCSIDGEPMQKQSEELDMPASMAAEKSAVPGAVQQSGPQLDGTLFAFAQAHVDAVGDALLYCELDEVRGSYVVYEPSAD